MGVTKDSSVNILYDNIALESVTRLPVVKNQRGWKESDWVKYFF